MRPVLKFIIPIMVVMAAVLLASGIVQTLQEDCRLRADLERLSVRAALAVETITGHALSNGSPGDLTRALESFVDGRQYLTGLAVYGAETQPLAATAGFGEIETAGESDMAGALETARASGSAQGFYLPIGAEEVYARVSPMPEDPAGRAHWSVLLYRAGFITERIDRIWRLNLFRFFALGIFVSLTAFVVFYLSIWKPAQRTAEWVNALRTGRTPNPRLDPGRTPFLSPLAREVSKMAVSLAQARAAAEEEARLRQSSDSLWTPERLKEFVRIKLNGRALYVVSNREPYQHIRRGNQIECVVPPSGLVTAIEPVLKACGGTWIAEGNGDADRETADTHDRLRVPPEEPQYTLRRVWLSKEEEMGYYYGFSNEGLWPLCHIAHTRPTFREQDWLMYESVNRKFARAVLEELEGSVEPCVLIQDYHFALLPRLIKNERPDARVTIFWHIPWPNPESFAICPWQNELLKGMLAADLIGFHTQFHCNNFLQTVDRLLESRIDYEHFTVNREGHTTWVKPFPISIAFLGNSSGKTPAGAPQSSKGALLKPHGVSAEWMGVGVDRLDYTKGILERFRSVELFLERIPSYVGRFTFVELAAPSRSLIPKYQEFMAEVEREAERINARFRTRSWKPIVLLVRQHGHKEIEPFYRAADVCMVTSLHDGMNLVAKEFVTARDDERGALILSQFTGAARELKDALIINPYDIGQTAEALRAALEMPESEQIERMRRMRDLLKDRNVYRWAADLMQELAAIRLDAVPARVNGS